MDNPNFPLTPDFSPGLASETESAYLDYLKSEGAMKIETFPLPLRHNRTLKLTAPLVITPAELNRIQNWIAVQLIVQPRLTPGEVNFGDMIGG